MSHTQCNPFFKYSNVWWYSTIHYGDFTPKHPLCGNAFIFQLLEHSKNNRILPLIKRFHLKRGSFWTWRAFKKVQPEHFSYNFFWFAHTLTSGVFLMCWKHPLWGRPHRRASGNKWVWIPAGRRPLLLLHTAATEAALLTWRIRN